MAGRWGRPLGSNAASLSWSGNLGDDLLLSFLVLPPLLSPSSHVFHVSHETAQRTANFQTHKEPEPVR